MNFKPVFCLTAAVALLLVTSKAHAQYFDVDAVTLPGGPFSIIDAGSSHIGADYTLSGTVVNSSAFTFNNVDFLTEFFFDTTSTSPAVNMPYSGGTPISVGTFSDGPRNLVVSDASGTLLISDTNLPLTSGTFDGASGTLTGAEYLPYIGFGTIGPGGTASFTETFTGNSVFPSQIFGSFVSTTPVPEPSTLVLLGIGAMGAILIVGKRRSCAAI